MKQEISPVAFVLLLAVVIAAVAFGGYKILGSPARSSTGKPVPTQANPGGPPPGAMGSGTMSTRGYYGSAGRGGSAMQPGR